jgi:hypothetical protein
MDVGQNLSVLPLSVVGIMVLVRMSALRKFLRLETYLQVSETSYREGKQMRQNVSIRGS